MFIHSYELIYLFITYAAPSHTLQLASTQPPGHAHQRLICDLHDLCIIWKLFARERKMAANEEDEVYCLCRRPYDESEFMIECDICNDWFHGRLVASIAMLERCLLPRVLINAHQGIERAINYLWCRCFGNPLRPLPLLNPAPVNLDHLPVLFLPCHRFILFWKQLMAQSRPH